MDPLSHPNIRIEGLLRSVFDLEAAEDEIVFYRGHSRNEFKLEPRLFRNHGWRHNEDLLINESLAANPFDFRNDRSLFEKLVRMQHHKLPTRLLDMTSNALVALYFACFEFDEEDADLVAIKLKKAKIKYSDSDTVSCIANLARLTAHERASINTTLGRDEFNGDGPIPRLLHFIKEEKSYFQNVIIPVDLRSIVCVRPKINNDRIISQSGAFLLFGLTELLEQGPPHNFLIHKIRIGAKSKAAIRRDLKALNVHVGTVYPNLDSSSEVIRDLYKDPK